MLRNTFRGKVFRNMRPRRDLGSGTPATRDEEEGELHLQDWFVPVLFQEEVDPQLVNQVPHERVQAILQEQRRLALGQLPQEPGHTFVGRSRELLGAERLLERERYVVLRGQGGE